MEKSHQASSVGSRVPEFNSPLQCRVVRVIEIAQVGYASWFFGNLYEAIVKVPDRIAHGELLASALSFGSPVLYYIPGMILILVGTFLLIGLAWRMHGARRMLVAVAVCVALGVLVTGYLVPTVNLKLFMVG